MYLRLYANYIRGVQKMCQRGNNRNNQLYNPSLKADCDYYVSLLTRNINLLNQIISATQMKRQNLFKSLCANQIFSHSSKD